MIWPRTAGGALLVTEDAVASAWDRGLLRRSADGALVVSQTVPGVRQHNGFCIQANGAICYTPGGATVLEHGGFARGANAEIVTTAVDPGLPLHHGLRFDSTGRAFVSVAGIGFAGAAMADSPARYWKADETGGLVLVDTAGNANATAVGGVTLGGTPAIASGHSIATGAAGYITSGSVITAPLTSWTVEAWVRKTAPVNGATIFIQRTGANLGLVGVVTNAAGLLGCNIRDDAGNIDFLVATAGNVADGAWHHVAVKMNGATVTYYVDGVPVGATSTRVTAVGAITTSEARFGADTSGGSSAWWNGDIDEMLIYQTPLSDARIAAHYAARTI